VFSNSSSGVYQDITTKHPAEALSLFYGKQREVGDGVGFNLSVFAIAFSEQDSGRGVSVRDSSDTHAGGLTPIYILCQALSIYWRAFTDSCKKRSASKQPEKDIERGKGYKDSRGIDFAFVDESQDLSAADLK